MDQMKSTMNGWLKPPKTKAERAKNAAIAVAARKRIKESSIKKSYQTAKENVSNGQRKTNTANGKTKTNKRKSAWEDDDEEEEEPEFQSESEDSFVEEDESSSEEEEEVMYAEESEPEVQEIESDDEEEVKSPSPTPRKPARSKTNKNTTITLDSDDDDDSSSDSDGGTLGMAQFKSRASKPTAALRKAQQAAKNRTNPSSWQHAKSTSERMPFLNNLSPPATASSKKKKTKMQLSDSDDDDDDDSLLNTPEFKKPKTSKHFKTGAVAKRPANDSLSDDDDDDDVLPTNKSKKQRQSRDSMDSLGSIITKSAATKEESVQDAWADSPDPVHNGTKTLTKKKKKKLSKKNPFAQFANQDEEMAMAMAMSESLMDASQDHENDVASGGSAKSEKKEVIDVDNEEHDAILVDSDDDDDDDDNEDDANDDDAYDEEKEAATNVLQTAEGLSARVLQTMKTWMSSTKDENDDAHKGMIIEDGALALGGMNDDDATNAKEWISQEHMQQVLPQVKLSKYQLIGVNWMALLHTMECQIDNGRNKRKTTNVNGILADEMGLGKTVQTISFLAYLRHQRLNATNANNNSMPHLIVVPVSVLPNWVREFEKFAPDMNVVKYHGSLAEREELQYDLQRYLPKNNNNNSKKKNHSRNKKWSKHLGGASDSDESDNMATTANKDQLDVILAPVTYFQKEKSEDRKFLNKFQFDYLVVDEAHMLKNAQSTRYKMLEKTRTRHRLLLTGTPVQNSPQELLNMLCFIMPLFSQGGGSASYEDNDGSVSERMLQHFVEHETMEEGGNEEKAYQKLKRLFAPFVLRRKKSDVIAQMLPPKERVVEYVELDMDARSVYEGILAAHVNKSGTKPPSAGIGDSLFTNLRKAAHHPLLLRNRHTTPKEIRHMTEHFHKYGAFKGEGCTRARVEEELEKFNDFHIHLTALELIDENPNRRPDLERYILPEQALFSSAKFTRLQKLLPNLISDGHRVLIFSVWTSCLDLLGCLMEHLGLKYLRMDGSCPANERQELIDSFNQDSSISVFLLSTKACGLGINLTAADTCIIHDLDFNPFNDLQAEDRCHRIGQKKKVTVYKMVTKETVDADIYAMQERKAKMNEAIMESKESSKARREMLNQEIQKFLGSPKGEKSTNKKVDEVEFV